MVNNGVLSTWNFGGEVITDRIEVKLNDSISKQISFDFIGVFDSTTKFVLADGASGVLGLAPSPES